MLQEFKLLFKLSLPIAMMQMLISLFGFVDTMFLGRVSALALAGAGIGHAAMAIAFLVGMGSLLGIDTLAAKAFGRGQLKKCGAYLIHTQVLALVTSVLLVGWLQLMIGPIFDLLNINNEVKPVALQYFRISSISLFFSLQFVACRHFLQSMHVTRPLLVILILANALNALADWVFIFGKFGMPAYGVYGAAMATVATNLLSFLLAWLISWRKMFGSGFTFRGFRFKSIVFRRLIELGLPSGMQIFLEVGVFTAVTAMIGQFDKVVIAAHQVVMNLASFTFMFPLGISFATAVIVGNHLGTKQRAKAIMAGNAALIVATLFMMVACAAFVIVPRALGHAYTSELNVVEAMVPLLVVAGVFQIFDGIQAVLTGAFRGMGNTRLAMHAHLFGHWVVGFPVGYILAMHCGMQAMGYWIGLCCGLITVSIILGWVWYGENIRHGGGRFQSN